MTPSEIRVQPCGCIPLPHKISSMLGIVPGTASHLSADRDRSTLALRVLGTAAPAGDTLRRAACPIPSPKS